MFVHKINADIYLKSIQLADAERVFSLTEESRAYLREWLPWLDTMTEVEHTRKFITHCLQMDANKRSLHTVVSFKGEIVGVASFNEIDWSNRVAYIGYWLGEAYQGHGIITQVVNGLIDLAFNELKLNRVDIRAAAGNQKSRAIPESLGFVNEGRIRKAEWLYDHYVDHVIYGMLAEEWRQLTPKLCTNK